MRLPTDGDDVNAAVAVEIGCREVFHGDSAIVEDVPRPFLAWVIHRFVEPDAAPLTRRFALVVAAPRAKSAKLTENIATP
jgi:hypothetical protein